MPRVLRRKPLAPKAVVAVHGKTAVAVDDDLQARPAPPDDVLLAEAEGDVQHVQPLREEAGSESADGSDPVDEITALLDAAGLQHENIWPHRLYYTAKIVSTGYDSTGEELERSTRAEADLVSSQTLDGKHAPAIDIDMPCRLIPSGTEGHFHLYIEKEISFDVYMDLLKALVNAGIVQKEFYEMSKRKKASYLRVPNKPKGGPQTTRLIKGEV